MPQQHKWIISLGNVLSIFAMIAVDLFILFLGLSANFSDGTPNTPLWVNLLAWFIILVSIIFAVLSVRYSHKKDSIRWAFAPFLVFLILACGLIIMLSYK